MGYYSFGNSYWNELSKMKEFAIKLKCRNITRGKTPNPRKKPEAKIREFLSIKKHL